MRQHTWCKAYYQRHLTPTVPGAASTVTGAASTVTGAASTAAGSLVGSTAGTVTGSTITYPNVLPTAVPGASLALTTTGSGVKEAVTLGAGPGPTAGATAPAAGALSALGAGALTYTLTTGGGLHAALAPAGSALGKNTVVVTNAKGETVFTLPAPFMDDASGAHSDDITVTLTPAVSGSSTLTVTPSPTWLAAPERAWPVVIDPTIAYPSAITGCAITSAAATTSSCNSGSPMPISWDTSGTQKRALLTFPTLFDTIPADAEIAQATLQVKVTPNSSAAATSVDVKELTNPFTTSATWNTRDGSTAWSSAGGDRGPAVARAMVNPATIANTNSGYAQFDVASSIQHWVEGSSAYDGFELEKTSATSGGAPVTLTRPNDSSLYVEWDPRAGDRKGNTLPINLALDDATSLAVNPATGNALVTTRQLKIAGVGLDLSVTHTSNSVGTSKLGVDGARWTDSLSSVGIQPHATALLYTDASGANWAFYPALDGTWIRPSGFDADLVATGSGSTAGYTITDRRSKVVQTFTNIGTASSPFYGLSKVTDRNGNAITFTYDSSATLPYNGHLILRSVTDTRGRALSITNYGYWNAYLSDVANRSPDTTVTNNQLASEDNAAGGTTKYEYDSSDRVTAVTVPEGQRTELTYDDSGRVTQIKRIADNGTNPTWGFSYGTFTRTGGIPATSATVTDPNGHTTTYASDGRGRVGTTTDARGNKTTNSFTANDDTLTATGATSGVGAGGATVAQTTTNTYDGAGASVAAATWNLTSATTPTGAGITNTYGTGTRLYDVATSTDARGTQTSYGYDGPGNQTSVTRGGLTTKNLYQGDTDPDYGGTVNCGPVVNGSPSATKAGVLCETRDGAYTKGSSAASTTAHRTAYTYDATGQMATMLPATPSAQQQQTYYWDSLSRLDHVTDGRGNTTYYGYDAMDRMTYTGYQDGRVVSHYFNGDAGNGWLVSIDEYPPNSDATDRHTDYNRDDEGRLQDVNSPEDNINLDYDPKGNLTSYADSGGTVTYGYNAADQLTSLALPGGDCSNQSLSSPGAASTKCVLFGVDADGRRTMTRYPGGQTMATTLDNSGRLAEVIGTTVAAGTSTKRLDLAYTYSDANAPSTGTNPNRDTSLVTSVNDVVAASKTTYSYDTLDRLTVASTAPSGGGSTTRYEGFCYDGAGNRTKYLTSSATTCTSGTPAATYTYDGANEMTAASGVTPTGAQMTGSGFSYDGNGNQTSATSAMALSTAYNTEEAASSFTPAGGAAVPQSYAYSSGGNEERTSSGSGSGATSFAVSPLSPAPAWASTGGTSTWAVRDPSGTLVAVRAGASASTASEYYPVIDNVGSVRAMFKGDGTVSNTYSYSAYGVTLSASEASGAPTAYRYGGGYTDPSSSLIKLGARYYDATSGRFTQIDPASQDANLYLYAGDNPETFSDPSGLWYLSLSVSGCAYVCGTLSFNAEPTVDHRGYRTPALSISGGISNGPKLGADARFGVSQGHASGRSVAVTCDLASPDGGVYGSKGSSGYAGGVSIGAEAGCSGGASTTLAGPRKF